MGGIRIGQVTDLHARRALAGTAGIAQRKSREMERLLPLALEQLRAMGVDVVAVTGDLLDVPNELLAAEADAAGLAAVREDYWWLQGEFARSGLPTIVLPGNHDHERCLWEVFGRERDVFEVKGYRFYRFGDREHEGHVPRRVGRDRALFERSLEEAGPQVHLQHYVVTPALNEGYPHTFEDGEALAQQTAQAGRAVLSLAGHYHTGTGLIERGRTWFAVGRAFCEVPHPYRVYEIAGGKVRMEEFELGT